MFIYNICCIHQDKSNDVLHVMIRQSWFLLYKKGKYPPKKDFLVRDFSGLFFWRSRVANAFIICNNLNMAIFVYVVWLTASSKGLNYP